MLKKWGLLYLKTGLVAVDDCWGPHSVELQGMLQFRKKTVACAGIPLGGRWAQPGSTKEEACIEPGGSADQGAGPGPAVPVSDPQK